MSALSYRKVRVPDPCNYCRSRALVKTALDNDIAGRKFSKKIETTEVDRCALFNGIPEDGRIKLSFDKENHTMATSPAFKLPQAKQYRLRPTSGWVRVKIANDPPEYQNRMPSTQ